MRVFIHDMEKAKAEDILKGIRCAGAAMAGGGAAGEPAEGESAVAEEAAGSAAISEAGAGDDADAAAKSVCENAGSRAEGAGSDSEVTRGGADDVMIIDACEKAVFCKGCFGCWLETPGKCVISDRLKDIGSILLQADEITIISRCQYGGYSTEIKKLMDRSIPGVMPFFVHKGGEMHHSARYDGRPALKAIFYNDVSEKMKETAERFVKANGVNFWASSVEVYFAAEDGIAELL